jgi:hypothetical protein
MSEELLKYLNRGVALWQTKGFEELAKGKNLEAKGKRFRLRERIAAKMNISLRSQNRARAGAANPHGKNGPQRRNIKHAHVTCM